MTLKKKVISIILALLMVVIVSTAVYGFSIFNSISGASIDDSKLSINSLLDSNKKVLNVVLFGVDGRDDVDGDRSDTIMIASINFETGDAKIISVMRDLMVRIPETDSKNTSYEKINAAYAYGGAQLAVQTLNENFDLNIRDYVVVNFDCLVDTVDALGGVDVNISSEDVLYWTNQYIYDVNDKVKKSDPFLKGTGIQHLTGVQALAFCRNRYSDSDYGRTERQREVFQQIAEKDMNVDLLTAINLIGKVYPYVTSSFTLQEISTYAQAFLSLENKNILNSRLPFDSVNTTDLIDGASYLIPTTLADNARVLHGYLYGDSEYVPSDTLQEISKRIVNISGYSSTVDWTTTTWQDIRIY
ncbi:LCP family protein [Eubacterium aggregans]|uniref:LCP family protein n=1 Tax=Eubacterium aggregans TaxID=81409 RepID=UPI003F2BB339